MDISDSDLGSDHFTSAAQRVVDYLNAHTPLKDWAVVRVSGGEHVQLHVHRQDVAQVGMRMVWPTTQCSRMADGADHVVPDAAQHRDYQDLEISQHLRTYAGARIDNDDGSLFGVLCGVRGEPLQLGEHVDGDLVVLFSDLLSEQLRLSRTLDRGRRQLEISEALSKRDALTGLLNRQGWDILVRDAQQRIDAFGDLVSIAVIDLDGLKQINDRDGHQVGDDVLRRTGAVLAAQDRVGDRIARYGGDEFAILAQKVPLSDIADYFDRFVRALDDAGIAASLGCAPAVPGATVAEAFARADALMYDVKRARQAAARVE